MITIDSVLRAALCGRGARLAEFLGCELPADFGDVSAEWHAARQGCAVHVAAHRILLAATGADRVEFLQGMLSNDVKSLDVGGGIYAAHLTQQGKLVADLRLYAQAEQMLIDVLTVRAEPLREALGRFIVADDVEIEPLESLTPLLALEGPNAARVLGEIVPVTVPGGSLRHERSSFRGAAILVVGSSEIDGPGYLLCGAPTLARELFEAAVAVGATPIGMEAISILRIEAGIPWYGIDMDETCLIMEAGLARAISFKKGCYLGQEVVERIAARGHVNRRLAGLRIEGDEVPALGTPISVDGREVGEVTSAVRSIALEQVVALAYVHRNALEPGTTVELRLPSHTVRAAVSSLPLVSRAV